MTTINGSGNSNSEQFYETWDSEPALSQYYKISQHDYNGSVVSYVPVSANCLLTIEPDWSISAFPNPVESEGFIKIKSPETYEATLKINDIVGKEIYSKQITVLQGENEYSFQINGTDAMYVLNIENHQNIKNSLKIMIRK